MASKPSESTRLFVGNLSWGMTEDLLKEAFKDYTVLEAKVIFDRYTGRSRGFGFVTLSTAEEAALAKENMNGVELEGRSVRVDFASERN